MHCDSLNHQEPPTQQHSITSQKTWIFSITAVRTPDLGSRTSPRKSLTLRRSVTCILRNANKEKVCIFEGMSLHCVKLCLSVTVYWHYTHLLWVSNPSVLLQGGQIEGGKSAADPVLKKVCLEHSVGTRPLSLIRSIETSLLSVRKCRKIRSSVILVDVSMEKY